jgi:hypothetical protein
VLQNIDLSQLAFGHVNCLVDGCAAMGAGTRRRPVRNAMIGWMMVAALLLGMSIGRAADNNETSMTVQVSSAEHETDEGYFSLGKDATVMAKPGSALHQFLARQNGRQVRVTLTLVDGRQLSRLER